MPYGDYIFIYILLNKYIIKDKETLKMFELRKVDSIINSIVNNTKETSVLEYKVNFNKIVLDSIKSLIISLSQTTSEVNILVSEEYLVLTKELEKECFKKSLFYNLYDQNSIYDILFDISILLLKYNYEFKLFEPYPYDFNNSYITLAEILVSNKDIFNHEKIFKILKNPYFKNDKNLAYKEVIFNEALLNIIDNARLNTILDKIGNKNIYFLKKKTDKEEYLFCTIPINNLYYPLKFNLTNYSCYDETFLFVDKQEKRNNTFYICKIIKLNDYFNKERTDLLKDILIFYDNIKECIYNNEGEG